MTSNELADVLSGWINLYGVLEGEPSREEYLWAYEEVNEWLDEDPERLWDWIKLACQRDLPIKVAANIAAGPLEDLIRTYGARFIDRMEDFALTEKRFRFLLGGVWKVGDERIWWRIGKFRTEVW